MRRCSLTVIRSLMRGVAAGSPRVVPQPVILFPGKAVPIAMPMQQFRFWWSLTEQARPHKLLTAQLRVGGLKE